MKKHIAIFILLLPATLFAQRISTIIGGGTSHNKKAKEQSVNPRAVTVDENGNLITTDRNVVWRVVNGNLQVIAGTALSGYSGDGGPATQANLANLSSIYYDKKKHVLYIADQNGSLVRRVDEQGIITTIAGTNIGGYTGDGGSALQARISVAGMFTAINGTIYLVQSAYGVVRKIDTTGIISTIAGIGTNGFSGDGGLATVAMLNRPSGGYADAVGNIYIADGSNFRVRKIDDQGTISTVAGTGATSFTGTGNPAINTGIGRVSSNIDFDNAGNMYLLISNRVLIVNTMGIVELLAGNGTTQYTSSTAVNTGLNSPTSICVAKNNDVFIGLSLRVFRVSSGEMYVEAGNNYLLGDNLMPANEAQLYQPLGGLAKPNGQLFFSSNTYLLNYDSSGTLNLATASELNPDSSTTGIISFGLGFKLLGLDKKGNLYFFVNNSYLKRLDSTGKVWPVAGQGSSGFTGDGGLAINAKISLVGGFAVDSIGNIYISDYLNYRIRKIDTAGIISTFAGNGSSTSSGDGGLAINAGIYPLGICFDKKGNLLVINGGITIRKISSQGYVETIAGNGSSVSTGDGGSALLAGMVPSHILVNNSGEVLIADRNNGNIRLIDSSGIIKTFAGAGSSYAENVLALGTKVFPDWLAFTPNGNLLIGETINQRIRKIVFPVYWTGAVNTFWEEPGNWSNGQVPGANDDVAIKQGMISVNSNVTIKSLQLSPGVNFNVAQGFTFTITN